MKNSLRDFKLWQQKRNELKVDTNPEQDWAEMSNLLDEHLPVSPKSNTPGGKPGLTKFGGIAGLSVVIIAIAVYLMAHFAGNKTDKAGRDSLKRQTELVTGKDSLSARNPSGLEVAKDRDLLADKAKTESTASAVSTLDESSGSNANVTDAALTKPGSINGVAKPGSGNLAAVNPVSGNVMLKNNIVPKLGKGSVLSGNGKKRGANSGTQITNSERRTYSNGYSAKGRLGNANNGRGRNGRPNQWQNTPGSNTSNTLGKSPSGTGRNNDRAGLINQNAKDTIGTSDDTFNQFMTSVQSGLLKGGFNNREIINLSNRVMVKDNLRDKDPSKSKDKKPKTTSSGTSRFDYGILGGANVSNSLAVYGGVYGAYHINDKWGFNLQGWGLSTQTISGGYSHANGSKVDSGKIIRVTDSRKAYFVNVPLHVTYNITDNFSVKAGPVLSIPVKQANGVTSLTPTTISKDTVYYRKTISQINATKYDQQLNFGVSGGVRYQYNRFSIEATYLKNLSGFNVTSDYGTYKANGAGTLNITLGIQLNRVKR